MLFALLLAIRKRIMFNFYICMCMCNGSVIMTPHTVYTQDAERQKLLNQIKKLTFIIRFSQLVSSCFFLFLQFKYKRCNVFYMKAPIKLKPGIISHFLLPGLLSSSSCTRSFCFSSFFHKLKIYNKKIRTVDGKKKLFKKVSVKV